MRTSLIMVTVLLAGCSSAPTRDNTNYGLLENARESGVVVSERQIGVDVADETIEYVVKKDSGQQVTIDQTPDESEAILYPGQRVTIQTNGKYLRVYPADVENPRR